MYTKFTGGVRKVSITVPERKQLTNAKALLGELARHLDGKPAEAAKAGMVGIEGALMGLDGEGPLGPNDVDLTSEPRRLGATWLVRLSETGRKAK